MMGNREFFWSQCRRIGLNLELVWATPRYFTFRGDISVLLYLWGISGELSLLPSSKSGLLTCLIGNKEFFCTQCRGITPHLSAAGSLMGFLELQREARVCSRVTAEEVIKNFCLFTDVRTPIWLRCTDQESKLGLAGQYGLFWRWGRRPRLTF